MKIEQTLDRLAKRRPIFHSEADFQHALAWQIQQDCPSSKIRLERRPNGIGRKMYVDIWIEHDYSIVAIELKYKTSALQTTHADEHYNLLNQSAQDIARYDFCKDICRIEELSGTCKNLSGFAIFLTNDSGYWRKSKRSDTIDASFRIHDSAALSGDLVWGPHASEGTMKGRTDRLNLVGSYKLAWEAYSNIGSGKGAEFRSLCVTVRSLSIH